ncbi:MAG: hypothetical protein EON55_18185 [Alphaproteobacteria bacterium]|nr:MAG: hypothetical protein EON55_18185 [Alphaproteobacteria bacterium]
MRDEREREWWPVWPLIVMLGIFAAPMVAYSHHTRWTFDSYGMDGAVPLLIGVFLIWPLFGIAIIGYSLGLIASVASHMLMRRRRDRIDADE